jgi:chorismate synthase
VCRRLLSEIGVEVFAHVVRIGDVSTDVHVPYTDLRDRARASDLACADLGAEARMREAIHAASHDGDTLGGVFEVVALGLPAGLGSHVQWDRKLDGRLAQALMSIPAIKGVEIGDGFAAATRRGSLVHDPIGYDAAASRFTRPSNHAGGLEGGITNGEALVCRAAMKPISTLRRALPSVDISTKQPFDAAFERSDICAVAAAGVVGEAMVLVTLADAVLEKFGSDSMRELLRNVAAYREQLCQY